MPFGEQSIITSANSCKYIAGDPKQEGWSYCGGPTLSPGSPWCDTHHSIVYGLKHRKPKAKADTVSTGASSDRGLEDPMLLSGA